MHLKKFESIYFTNVFLITTICGHVNATFEGKTHLLLINKEVNCSSVFNTTHKPKCSAFFIVNHGCIVVNDNFLKNYVFSMPCLFVEICGIDIV